MWLCSVNEFSHCCCKLFIDFYGCRCCAAKVCKLLRHVAGSETLVIWADHVEHMFSCLAAGVSRASDLKQTVCLSVTIYLAYITHLVTGIDVGERMWKGATALSSGVCWWMSLVLVGDKKIVTYRWYRCRWQCRMYFVLCGIRSLKSTDSFKRQLKTHLFRLAY